MPLSQSPHHRQLAIIILFALNIASPFVLANETLSFTEAWNQVQQRNDGIAAGQANLERTELLSEATRGLNYPRVDLISAYTKLDSPIQLNALDFNPLSALRGTPLGGELIELGGGDAAFTTELSGDTFARSALTAVWPVYTGGRITAAQQVSDAQRDVAANFLDAKRRIVFEELVQVYFGVVLAKQNYATRVSAENGLKRHLDDAISLEDQGVIARVERFAVEAAHDRASVASNRARQELEIAEITLQQLLQQDTPVATTDELFTNEKLPSVQQFIVAATENSPSIKTLEAQDTEASALLKAERGRFHPEVFLFADYAVYQDDSLAFDLVPDWQVGIGMNITLLDRISRSKTVSATEKARASIRSLDSEARREVSVATQILHREADIAVAEFDGLVSTLKLAAENLRLRRVAFTQGVSTSTELIDAQLFIAAVRTEMSAAAFRYIDRLAKILALTGETQRFAQFQRQGVPVSLTFSDPGVHRQEKETQ